jgi:hypothetical protein
VVDMEMREEHEVDVRGVGAELGEGLEQTPGEEGADAGVHEHGHALGPHQVAADV